jgi:hypothetical protein
MLHHQRAGQGYANGLPKIKTPLILIGIHLILIRNPLPDIIEALRETNAFPR